MFKKPLLILLTSCLIATGCSGQSSGLIRVTDDDIENGAERTGEYLQLLEGKKTGIVVNQSSLVDGTHLIDTLLSHGVQIIKIFSPEHGLRGNYSAGALISDDIDPETGIGVISLYGKKKKPSPADMDGIEIMVFDIQDVGARFYTYTSTMTYVMEACSEAGIPLIILDRPNPNGFYVDGPILEPDCRSFVGLHPVPVVHGLTTAEYAQMINGEGWLDNNVKCNLTVIPVKGYTRNMIYDLPVNPSPNLPNPQSVYLYPSLCLFEGTIISIGRGTGNPFQVIGHPNYGLGSLVFTPRDIEGASINPKYEGTPCYGFSLAGYAENYRHNKHHFNISYLLNMYNYFKDDDFFNDYFDLLAGTKLLKEQIITGMEEEEIRASWEQGILEYKEKRHKYLLYP